MKNNKKRNNTLFALEQKLFGDQTSQQQSHQPTEKKQKKQKKRKHPQKQAQAFDFGEAIELRYNGEAFPTATPEAESLSTSNSFASELEDDSLPFEVEAFEVDREVTPVSKPVTPQPQPPLQPEIEPEVVPEAMEIQPVKATVVPPSETSKSARSVKQPTTVTPNTSKEELSDAQAFAEDLQAILNGEKTYDAEQQQVVPTSSSTSPPAASTPHPHDIFDKGQTTISPQQPIQPEPPFTSRSHAVFDQMGKNMAHATDFDQGTLELSLEQRFNEFDRILDVEESKSNDHLQHMAQMMGNTPNQKIELKKTAYTVCFSGTSCTRDEGEATRSGSLMHPGSDKGIYSKKTGYIPVRIHKEISGEENLREKTESSVTVRGVGENDWHDSGKESEELNFDTIKGVPQKLLKYVEGYSGGNQQGKGGKEATGWSAVALALHGANLAAESGAAGGDVDDEVGTTCCCSAS